jgi:DNA-binding transcriptional ArsR family regulator
MRSAAEIPAGGDVDIAALASLLADPARCKVLLALDDGRALPASVLAEEAGITRQTASSHLGKLTGAGLLAVETHGRHRYYRLAGPEVGELLEQLGRLAPSRPVRSLREGTRAARLRSARTCYDHVAGRLGVAVMGNLLDREALVGGDGRYDPRRDGHDALSRPGHDLRYELTDNGRDFLTGIGVEMPTDRRPLALLRGLDRATAPPVRRAGPGDVRSVPVGRLGQAGTAWTGAHGHRRRPHRVGRRVRHRVERLAIALATAKRTLFAASRCADPVARANTASGTPSCVRYRPAPRPARRVARPRSPTPVAGS